MSKQNYTTRCWLCSSPDLEPDEKGMRCKACGATFNVIPKPTSYPIVIKPDPVTDGQSTSPSYLVCEAAAKARSNATH